MRNSVTWSILLVVGMLMCTSLGAGGAADKVTGGFRHAGPAHDPGDVVYTKRISAHEAMDGRPQHGFIFAVRPDGHTWEYIDLSGTDTACVNVYEDGKARIGGLVTDGTGPGLGRYFGWALQDNGEPGRLSDRTTTLRFDTVEHLMGWCEDGSTGWANAVWPHVVVSGNLQIHNSPADGD